MNAKTDKILVVDDHPDVLMLASEIFRLLGFDVLTANDGGEAVEILKQTPDIGVLFSDVVMPRMNGIDLGHAARRLVSGIKFVLTSGYMNSTLTGKNPDLHTFEFITKPYRIADIMKTLRRSG